MKSDNNTKLFSKHIQINTTAIYARSNNYMLITYNEYKNRDTFVYDEQLFNVAKDESTKTIIIFTDDNSQYFNNNILCINSVVAIDSYPNYVDFYYKEKQIFLYFCENGLVHYYFKNIDKAIIENENKTIKYMNKVMYANFNSEILNPFRYRMYHIILSDKSKNFHGFIIRYKANTMLLINIIDIYNSKKATLQINKINDYHKSDYFDSIRYLQHDDNFNSLTLIKSQKINGNILYNIKSDIIDLWIKLNTAPTACLLNLSYYKF